MDEAVLWKLDEESKEKKISRNKLILQHLYEYYHQKENEEKDSLMVTREYVDRKISALKYALAYICQHMGIKAQACNNPGYHGETLVQADGNFYIVVTGYDELKPRHYIIYETDKITISKIIENNSILLKYFEF